MALDCNVVVSEIVPQQDTIFHKFGARNLPLQRRKSIFDFTPKERFKMLKEVNTAEKQSGVGTGNIESAAYHDEHELTIIFWGLVLFSIMVFGLLPYTLESIILPYVLGNDTVTVNTAINSDK
ncbi:unnamed protein product [Oikopleura dioica]|uniref:Uncharacterized protein n=1 Tax=Oikopleura dioica TaxID=34765 RepID=E4XDW3_OIKDI|nr:unnamed protein product [Oikopleura dioica]